MDRISFKRLIKLRKSFLYEHREEDCYYEIGDNNILISVPHAVRQTRLGKPKYAEPGTVGVGLLLANNLGASYIVKTKNNFDDANFDERSNYRDKIEYILSVKGIKYLLDIHSLAKSRDCEINLGVNFGQNVSSDMVLYNRLHDELIKAGFNVSADSPFAAMPRTIAGHFAKKYNIWTIQIEINSKLTNESVNIGRFNTLIETLTNIFKQVSKS